MKVNRIITVTDAFHVQILGGMAADAYEFMKVIRSSDEF